MNNFCLDNQLASTSCLYLRVNVPRLDEGPEWKVDLI